MSRRLTLAASLLFLATAFLQAADAPGLAASNPDVRPIVGAIRWDAWYSDKGPVKEVERSLGPPKFHFRLPWFARVGGDDLVSINGDTPEIMARELAYAERAGLDYWAFVDYGPGSEMSRALDRYLAAPDKRGLRHCLILEGGRIDGRGPGDLSRIVTHFQRSDYVKVLEGRPLLFVFGPPKKYGREIFDELVRLSTAAGLKKPYLVLMGQYNPGELEKFGFEAVSEYAQGKGYASDHWTYDELTGHVERDLWAKWEKDKTPCVTFATTGWDTRPRHERPPTWCTWIKAAPDLTPPKLQKPLLDAVTARPEQIAHHVRAAVDWTRAHRDLNPSNCVIIYGWNENDEGGWLIPTLNPVGTPDEGRIEALGRVLRKTR